MTFDDYIEKQDHIEIIYWGEKSTKRVLSLDGVDLKYVSNITYYKYDTEKDQLLKHRLNGPSYICYYENGKLSAETWYQNGSVHRLDGPAIIFYDENGKLSNKRFYINDIEYVKSAYLKLGGKL